ncbi:uncharacterized protein CDAR_293861 [Caerostris darwini]|uniref:Sushi domain-containing protein n=1 Tax=Caerostris darwini TaxID=1538125 RepID=A0AAV4VGZ8_9ARAC|nr:uncharacterized protein CDAR_293861 [Caerostris darwini]
MNNGMFENEKRLISCLCANETKVTWPIDKETSTSIINKDVKQSVCEDVHSKDVCDLLSLCTKCEILSIKCTISETTGTPQCLNEIHSLKDDYFEHQEENVEVTRPPRIKRSSGGACAFPTNMKTADVDMQSSLYIRTYPEGRPHENDDVQKTGRRVASVSFHRLFSDSDIARHCGLLHRDHPLGPLCYISCSRYEDKPEVPRRAYECTLSGKWNRDLPFCVTSGSGLLLSSRPKNLL